MISQSQDIVTWTVRNTDIEIPYKCAFDIAQGLLLASRQAMKMAKEDFRKWDVKSDIERVETSKDKKRTKLKRFDWEVKIKDYDERVFFYAGNVEIILHFSEAIKISDEIRQHAKNAKAWAGDSSRYLNASGILTDAEKNYKLGL